MKQKNAPAPFPTRIGRYNAGYRTLADRLKVSIADISNYINGHTEKIGAKRLAILEEEFSKNQKSLILEDLLSGASITPMTALHRYGCFRLAARISDLRREGWPIVTDRSNRYATYKLVS